MVNEYSRSVLFTRPTDAPPSGLPITLPYTIQAHVGTASGRSHTARGRLKLSEAASRRVSPGAVLVYRSPSGY
eukprot:10045391-Alexandrium_andersonii.AAC.1